MLKNKLKLGKDDSYEGCFGEHPNCQVERCYHKEECCEYVAKKLKNILQMTKKANSKTQKDFLLELETICRITKPIFIDRNMIQWHQMEKELGKEIKIWEIADDKMVRAQAIQNVNIVGRYKINGNNSNGVWEFWFDIESNQSLDSANQINQNFKPLKKAVEQLFETIISLKIPQDYIYIKSSGRGFHVHFFCEGVHDEKQYQQFAEIIVDASKLPNVKSKEYRDLPDIVFGLDRTPCIQTVRKIREFGGINEKLDDFHYCSYVPYNKFKKMKTYPFITSAEKVEYPNIKVFHLTKDFLRAVQSSKAEHLTSDFKETEGKVNYDLDGNVEKLEDCPLIREIIERAKTKKHLINEERIFISQLYTFFGQKGETLGHKIIQPCNDYEERYTQYQFDCVKRGNKKPITCEWAKKNIGCPAECKGSGGKSPIKFAWQPKSLDQLKGTFKKWLNLTKTNGTVDDEIIDITLAASFDRLLKGNEKFWLFLVVRSGGVKTTLLKSLSKLPFIYTIDSITPKTLVSGVVIQKEHERVNIEGLMKHLEGKVLAIKDFTIILTKSSDERNAVFGDLRNAYDGYLEKGFGTGDEKISVKAHFGVIAACTPIIDNYWQMNQLLGERFLKLRHDIDDIASTRVAIAREGEETEMERELQNAVYSFYKGIDFTEQKIIPEDVREIVFQLAMYTARMRTPLMIMSQEGRAATFSGEREFPTRLAKQFMRILKLLCYVRSHAEPEGNDIVSMLRIAFDTPPLYRTKVVAYLYEHDTIDPSKAQKIIGCDYYTAERVLNEMQHIKVVEETSNGNFALTTAFLAILDALVNSISMVSRRKACCSIDSIVRGSRERERGKQNVIQCLLLGYYNIKSDPRKFDKQMHQDTEQQVEGEKLTDWNPD
jgi:hypothetical protein